jgi:hypothetical protein
MIEYLASGKVKMNVMRHEKLPDLDLDFTPDMIFIDGDHADTSVIRDIHFALKWLPIGGLLAGHDLKAFGTIHALKTFQFDLKNPRDTDLWFTYKEEKHDLQLKQESHERGVSHRVAVLRETRHA